tara:strand:- start:1642 stop:1851 length:210 start_codon:yes stop_codon:yes gene_type:complete
VPAENHFAGLWKKSPIVIIKALVWSGMSHKPFDSAANSTGFLTQTSMVLGVPSMLRTQFKAIVTRQANP